MVAPARSCEEYVELFVALPARGLVRGVLGWRATQQRDPAAVRHGRRRRRVGRRISAGVGV